MADQPKLELYEKRNATHTKVIGRYKNKTIKIVWFEKYGGKGYD